MEFRWHPEAVAEADAAASFYRERRRELGVRFVNSLDEALGRISIKPEIYRELEPGTRKTRLKTFPYALVYRVRNDKVEIIAVMHVRRRPGYWKDRV